MRMMLISVTLLTGVLIATMGTAGAQPAGPFCLRFGPPLDLTFNIVVEWVTGTRFLVVGHVAGEQPVVGSGVIESSQVRLTMMTGPRGSVMGAVPPLSVTALFALPLSGPSGTGFCAGGSDCATPTGLAVSLIEPCS